MTTGPNLDLHHLYSPGSKNALPFLSGGRKTEECFVTRERLNEIQIPASINEVLLEHSHAHWVPYCLCWKRWVLESETPVAHRHKNIYSLSYCWENVLTPAQNSALREPMMTISAYGSTHLGFFLCKGNILMNYLRSLSSTFPTNLYTSAHPICWDRKDKNLLSGWVISLPWSLEVTALFAECHEVLNKVL